MPKSLTKMFTAEILLGHSSALRTGSSPAPPPSGHPRASAQPHAVAPSGLLLRGDGRAQNITPEPIQGLHQLSLVLQGYTYGDAGMLRFSGHFRVDFRLL